METSMYDTEVPQHNAVNKLKRAMTLDFNTNSEPSKKMQKVANLLGSPDLNLLKLASPELERMIINQNGLVTTTPTPTQFLCPKYVTEEQEAYARGFVDALNELHKQQPGQEDDEPMVKSEPERPGYSLAQTAPIYTTLTTVQSTPAVTTQSFTTTTSLPGSVMAPVHSIAAPNMSVAPRHVLPGPGNLPALNHLRQTASPHQRILQLKEEPQTVPSNSPPPNGSFPISPINMDHQEAVKVDRKRARNRVAARKCRTRKLERISRLEDRVSDLKGQNTDLSKTATTLRDQVVKLKQQIMDHVNSGCQVVLSHNLL